MLSTTMTPDVFMNDDQCRRRNGDSAALSNFFYDRCQVSQSLWNKTGVSPEISDMVTATVDESDDDSSLASTTPSPVPSLCASADVSPVPSPWSNKYAGNSIALADGEDFSLPMAAATKAQLDSTYFVHLLAKGGKTLHSSSSSTFPFVLLVEDASGSDDDDDDDYDADQLWAGYYTSLDAVLAALGTESTTWMDPRIKYAYHCEVFDLRNDSDCYGAVDVAFRYSEHSLLHALYSLAIEAPTCEETTDVCTRLHWAIVSVLDEYSFYASAARAQLARVRDMYNDVASSSDNVVACLASIDELEQYIITSVRDDDE